MRKITFKDKTLTLFVCLTFVGGDLSYAAPILASGSAPQALAQNNLQKFSIPEELGSVQELRDSGKSQPVIFYIQDAHGIKDAQDNIQKLILYFQEHYRVSVVGVEGARDEVDPTLLRAFPDEFVKKKVLNSYLQLGEVSGAELAAALNPERGRFYGIEDWPLYQENYAAYAEADKNQKEVLEVIDGLKLQTEVERRNVYSVELSRFHEKTDAFQEEKLGILELADFLNDLEAKHAEGERQISESKTPHLWKLMSAVQSDSGQTQDLDAAIRQMSERFRKKLFSRLRLDKQREFNKQYQNYVTGMTDPGAYLKFLMDLGKEVGAKPKLSRGMRVLLGQVETFSMIKGTQLFKELNEVLEKWEKALTISAEEKKLAEKFNRLRMLKTIAKLELTREQLENYQKDPEGHLALLGDKKQLLSSALNFYRAALERDDAFMVKIKRILNKEKVNAMVVLSGGFHSEGMHRHLKSEAWSYVIVTPKINSLEGQDSYKSAMTGELSYREYLKKSFYDAFMQHAVLQLVKDYSEPEFKHNVKVWRDRVIKELAAEGRLAEAGEYTSYIDRLIAVYKEKYGDQIRIEKSKEEILSAVKSELENFNAKKVKEITSSLNSEVNWFMSAVNKLQEAGRWNQDNFSKLLRSSKTGGSSLAATAPTANKYSSDGLVGLRNGSITLDDFVKKYGHEGSQFGTSAVSTNEMVDNVGSLLNLTDTFTRLLKRQDAGVDQLYVKASDELIELTRREFPRASEGQLRDIARQALARAASQIEVDQKKVLEQTGAVSSQIELSVRSEARAEAVSAEERIGGLLSEFERQFGGRNVQRLQQSILSLVDTPPGETPRDWASSDNLAYQEAIAGFDEGVRPMVFRIVEAILYANGFSPRPRNAQDSLIQNTLGLYRTAGLETDDEKKKISEATQKGADKSESLATLREELERTGLAEAVSVQTASAAVLAGPAVNVESMRFMQRNQYYPSWFRSEIAIMADAMEDQVKDFSMNLAKLVQELGYEAAWLDGRWSALPQQFQETARLVLDMLSTVQYLSEENLKFLIDIIAALKVQTRLTVSETRVMEGHVDFINQVLVLPSGEIATAGSDRTVRIWDTETATLNRVLGAPGNEDQNIGHTSYVGGVFVLPNGNLVTVSTDSTAKVWDSSTDNLLRTLGDPENGVGHTNQVNYAAALPDGKLVTVSADHTVRIWDIDTGSLERTLGSVYNTKSEIGHTDFVNQVLVLPNGNLLTVSKDHTARIWDPATGALLRTLGIAKNRISKSGHTGSINQALLLPNGHLLTVSQDFTARIWNLETGVLLKTLGAPNNRNTEAGHTEAIKQALLLPNGNVLTVSADRTARIWDSQTGALLNTVRGHQDVINRAVLLPDGNFVTVSNDRTARVWDAPTGDLLATFGPETNGHASVVNDAAFLPDGNLVTVGYDSTARITKFTSRSEVRRQDKSRQEEDGNVDALYLNASGELLEITRREFPGTSEPQLRKIAREALAQAAARSELRAAVSYQGEANIPALKEGQLKDASTEFMEKGGWKLHLTVSKANAQKVHEWLWKTGVGYKYGRNSGQEGKDFTIYVGSRKEANEIADKMVREISNLLSPASGAALTDDMPMTEGSAAFVLGRFDTNRKKVGEYNADFNQYGAKGLPFLEGDYKEVSGIAIWGTDDEKNELASKQAAAIDRAYKVLEKAYGEYFTGVPAEPSREEKIKVIIKPSDDGNPISSQDKQLINRALSVKGDNVLKAAGKGNVKAVSVRRVMAQIFPGAPMIRSYYFSVTLQNGRVVEYQASYRQNKDTWELMARSEVRQGDDDEKTPKVDVTTVPAIDFESLILEIDPKISFVRYVGQGANGYVAEVTHQDYPGKKMALKIQKKERVSLFNDASYGMLARSSSNASAAHVPVLYRAYQVESDGKYLPVFGLSRNQDSSLGLEDAQRLDMKFRSTVNVLLMEFVEGLNPVEAFKEKVFGTSEDLDEAALASIKDLVSQLYIDLARANLSFKDAKAENMKFVFDEESKLWRIVVVDLGALKYLMDQDENWRFEQEALYQDIVDEINMTAKARDGIRDQEYGREEASGLAQDTEKRSEVRTSSAPNLEFSNLDSVAYFYGLEGLQSENPLLWETMVRRHRAGIFMDQKGYKKKVGDFFNEIGGRDQVRKMFRESPNDLEAIFLRRFNDADERDYSETVKSLELEFSTLFKYLRGSASGKSSTDWLYDQNERGAILTQARKIIGDFLAGNGYVGRKDLLEPEVRKQAEYELVRFFLSLLVDRASRNPETFRKASFKGAAYKIIYGVTITSRDPEKPNMNSSYTFDAEWLRHEKRGKPALLAPVLAHELGHNLQDGVGLPHQLELIPDLEALAFTQVWGKDLSSAWIDDFLELVNIVNDCAKARDGVEETHSDARVQVAIFLEKVNRENARRKTAGIPLIMVNWPMLLQRTYREFITGLKTEKWADFFYEQAVSKGPRAALPTVRLSQADEGRVIQWLHTITSTGLGQIYENLNLETLAFSDEAKAEVLALLEEFRSTNLGLDRLENSFGYGKIVMFSDEQMRKFYELAISKFGLEGKVSLSASQKVTALSEEALTELARWRDSMISEDYLAGFRSNPIGSLPAVLEPYRSVLESILKQFVVTVVPDISQPTPFGVYEDNYYSSQKMKDEFLPLLQDKFPQLKSGLGARSEARLQDNKRNGEDVNEIKSFRERFIARIKKIQVRDRADSGKFAYEVGVYAEGVALSRYSYRGADISLAKQLKVADEMRKGVSGLQELLRAERANVAGIKNNTKFWPHLKQLEDSIRAVALTSGIFLNNIADDQRKIVDGLLTAFKTLSDDKDDLEQSKKIAAEIAGLAEVDAARFKALIEDIPLKDQNFVVISQIDKEILAVKQLLANSQERHTLGMIYPHVRALQRRLLALNRIKKSVENSIQSGAETKARMEKDRLFAERYEKTVQPDWIGRSIVSGATRNEIAPDPAGISKPRIAVTVPKNEKLDNEDRVLLNKALSQSSDNVLGDYRAVGIQAATIKIDGNIHPNWSKTQSRTYFVLIRLQDGRRVSLKVTYERDGSGIFILESAQPYSPFVERVSKGMEKVNKQDKNASDLLFELTGRRPSRSSVMQIQRVREPKGYAEKGVELFALSDKASPEKRIYGAVVPEKVWASRNNQNAIAGYFSSVTKTRLESGYAKRIVQDGQVFYVIIFTASKTREKLSLPNKANEAKGVVSRSEVRGKRAIRLGFDDPELALSFFNNPNREIIQKGTTLYVSSVGEAVRSAAEKINIRLNTAVTLNQLLSLLESADFETSTADFYSEGILGEEIQREDILALVAVIRGIPYGFFDQAAALFEAGETNAEALNAFEAELGTLIGANLKKDQTLGLVVAENQDLELTSQALQPFIDQEAIGRLVLMYPESLKGMKPKIFKIANLSYVKTGANLAEDIAQVDQSEENRMGTPVSFMSNVLADLSKLSEQTTGKVISANTPAIGDKNLQQTVIKTAIYVSLLLRQLEEVDRNDLMKSAEAFKSFLDKNGLAGVSDSIRFGAQGVAVELAQFAATFKAAAASA